MNFQVVRRLAVVCAVFFSSTASILLTQQIAHAATLTVTSIGDTTNASDGVLTLREAIAAAVSGDTVTFDSSLFTSGRQYIDLASGIAVPGGVTIDGPGENLLTIRGTRVNGTIVSFSRSNNVATITLSAPPQFPSNAVVYIYGSTVATNGAKSSTSISGNSFTFADSGSDVLTTSASGTVASTSTTAFRAFTVSGQVTIKDLTIDGFFAERGGAIAGNNGARLTTDHVTFTNNVGYGNYCGGAINVNRYWLTVVDSTFTSNVARCASAIQMGDGSGTSMTITGSTFTNNVSEYYTIQSALPMTFVNSSMSGSKGLTNQEMTGINMGSFGMPFTMTNSTVSDPVIVSNSSRVIVTGSTLSSLSITDAFATLQNNNITNCTVSSSTAVDVSSGNTIGNASGCSVVSGVGAKIVSYSRTSSVLTLVTATSHGIQVGDTARICGVQNLALVVWQWCAFTATVLSTTSTSLTVADNRADVGSTIVYSGETDRATYVFTNVPYSLPQTVTWSPTTALNLGDSPVTPSAMASTNGDGAITYAVTSAGTTGCTVNSSTGVLTFTAAGSCTVRATAAGTSNWSSGSKSVTFVISGSSTSSTTTTTTTTTTVPGSSSAPNTDSTGSQSTGSQGSSGGTSNNSNQNAITSNTTQVTDESAVTQSTSTTTTIPAPEAPEAEPGEGTVLVGGKATTATVTRSNNRISIGAAGINVTLAGLTPEGDVIPLDSDGNMRVEGDDIISVEGSGFLAESDIELWMFSTPQFLLKVTTDSSGRVSESVTLPNDLESGNHRFVLVGQNANGEDATVSLGLIVGGENSGLSTTSKFLIALPIALAVLAGLILPTAIRRRREDENQSVVKAG